jgi:hypothetical protein
MSSGYQVPPRASSGAAPEALRRHTQQIAESLLNAMAGKINAVFASFTLTANVASTTLSDARLTTASWIDFDPLTANAAAEKAAGTLYVTSANRSKGSFVVTHANNAQTDRTFRVLIIG